MTPGDTATIHHPCVGVITGKVSLVRPSGIAIDDSRGVRHWVTMDRVRENVPAPRKYHHNFFGPLMLDLERELLGYG